ncbi:phage tail assembly protein, partial [Rodentibacter caecimuris]
MTDVTLTLLFPITDGEGKLLNELKIRRPKVKDIRNMKGSTEIEQSIS